MEKNTSIEDLLDVLFEMIDEAKNAPLSSDKCVIERDKALDLLDEIRALFPVELKEAQKLMLSRKDYIEAAKREAETIRTRADAEAKRMLDSNQVLIQAKQKSNEMIKVAEDRSRELRRAANEYCEDALSRTEAAVAEAHEELRSAKARFQQAAGRTAPAQPAAVRKPFFDAAEET